MCVDRRRSCVSERVVALGPPSGFSSPVECPRPEHRDLPPHRLLVYLSARAGVDLSPLVFGVYTSCTGCDPRHVDHGVETEPISLLFSVRTGPGYGPGAGDDKSPSLDPDSDPSRLRGILVTGQRGRRTSVDPQTEGLPGPVEESEKEDGSEDLLQGGGCPQGRKRVEGLSSQGGPTRPHGPPPQPPSGPGS